MNTTISKSPPEQHSNQIPSTVDTTCDLWIGFKLPQENPLYQVRFTLYLTHRAAWSCHSVAE